MRFIIHTILIGFTILLLFSCNTYKTYYNDTITQISNEENSKDILRLDLSESQDVIYNIDGLKNLRMLNVSTRGDINLDSLFLKLPNPKELRVLILDSMHLDNLPSTINRFTRLKQLSLNNNPDLKLEVVIHKIKDLSIEFLNFQHNEISEIPENIEGLTYLKDLNLSNNNLDGFNHFEYVSSIKHLSSLWLTDNKLSEFPTSLGSLQQLRNLYIEHNNLIDIPEDITGMKKVWVIHAGHNLFTELPANFGKMKSLILLHINNCQISSIPEVYSKKRSYSMLGLIIDNNKLSVNEKKFCRKSFGHFFVLSF